MAGDYGPLGEEPWSKGIMHTGGYDAPAERAAQAESESRSAPAPDSPYHFEPRNDWDREPHRSSTTPPSFEYLPVVLFFLAWYATYATARGMLAVFNPVSAGDSRMMMMASPAPLLGLFAGPAYSLAWWRQSERRRQAAPFWPWLWASVKGLALLGVLVFGAWLAWRVAWGATFNVWLDEFKARQVEVRSPPAREKGRAKANRGARRRPASRPRPTPEAPAAW